MGLGREVADAYISVHGDLSPFRKDLDGANASMKEWAEEGATEITEAWGQRMEAGWSKQWNSVIDSMYSGKKLDFNRMIEAFDPDDMENASSKISEMVETMRELGKLSDDQAADVVKNIEAEVKAWQDASDAQARHAELRKGWQNANLDMMEKLASVRQAEADEYQRLNDAMLDGDKAAAQIRKRLMEEAIWENNVWNKRRRDEAAEHQRLTEAMLAGDKAAAKIRTRIMEDAIAENERWARTFEGMTKNNGLDQMEKDFKSIAEATRSTDWSKFVKGFDGLDDAAGRVREINALMLDQKRISHENGIAAAASIDEYITGEKRLIAEKRRNLDHAAALLEAQDRYKRSLDGMVSAHHFARMEQDFKLLASAMASNDWRPIQRMSRDAAEFRARVTRVGNEMRSMGRMSDAAFTVMRRQITAATRGLNVLQVAMKRAGDFAGRFVKNLDLGTAAARLMGRGLDSVVGKIKGLAGFNVVGDVFREGGAFIQNLDRNAVKIAKMTALIGALGSVAVSSLGGAVTVLADLGAALGGLATVAPAFLIGGAIGAGVLVAAFKDMKTVLADLKPAFAKLQDNISKKFWDEAAKPIREMVKDLMPTLNTQLGNTGTAFGKMFGKLATAVKAVPKKDLDTMFERMNKGIDIAGDAMAPLTRAFVNLGLAGSKTFERFGTWIVKISDQFDAFIQRASDNGDLDRWINDAIEAMKDLGRVIDGTMGIFNALSKAARDAGSKGLDGFANSLQGIAKVMQGERFQGSLKTFFEAFYIGLDGVKRGFMALGFGVESFLPTLKIIMGSLADVFEKIGIITSQFLANKDLQDGMKKFAEGISAALDKLMPAIGPMATSLGQVFDLMGQVLPSVTDLIAKIAITWGPIFDKMLETLKPLIGPLTEFAKTLVDSLAPVFKTFVEVTLPPLVQLFKDLLPAAEGFVKLFTPVVNSLLEGAATQFKAMSDGLKEFNTHAGPAATRMGEIIKKMETTPTIDTGQGHWINTLFKFSTAAVTISPTLAFIGKTFDKLTAGIRENWSRFVTTVTGLLKPENIIKNLGSWYIDFSTANQELSDSVTDFFEGIPDVIKERWEGMWRGLTDWWRDVKKNFQKMMSDLLGFETGSEGAYGSVSGGAGGKGMSPSGKLDPNMFGLPDEEGTKGFFESLGTWLHDGFTGALGKLGEALGLNTFIEDWNLFWDTLPVKVQETWDAIILWVQTKAGEIKLAIDTFILDTQTNWTLFWDGLGLKVQEIWDAVKLWIDTKVAEIKLAIDTWIADVNLAWTTFWDGVRLKVEEIWNAVKTWIDTKINEVKTAIDTFITDTRTNWDTFWNGIKTKVETTWNDIKNWIDTKIREVKTNIDNFIRDVKTNWDNFWRDLPQKVRTGWDDIVRAFETGVDRAVEWVRGLPGRAVAALGNLGGKLRGHGEEMIEGFRKGLVAKFEEVKRFVGSIAQWIADNKGPISYDKVLLIPAGKAIMAGLGVGLRSQLPALKNTLDVVTATMSDAITETFAKSTMYVAGANAALGLAAGLKDNKSSVLDAFGQLLPPEAAVRIGASAGQGVGSPTPAGGTYITIEAGAIPVSTPTKDPGLVASKVIDGFANFSNF